MPRHGPRDAAVLAQRHGARLRAHPQGVEVVVQGVYIPAALIVPAAGLVHKAGIVQRADGLYCPGGIVLSPPLIEGHPAAHAGVAAQRLHRIFQLPAVFFPAAFAAPAQQLPQGCFVRQAAHKRLQNIGQVGNEPQVILTAAVDHILPDHKPQLVAVVVPALRLDLCVFAQQVVTQRLYLAQLPLHRRIRGRGVQPLRPVALIQQAVEQDGLIVQAKAQHAPCVRCAAPLAQGKVAVHGVELLFLSLRGAHGQVVQKGRVRAPWEEILVRNMQRHLTVLTGLVAAPVLGNGHTPGAHHRPQVRRAAGRRGMGFHGHRAGIIVRRNGERLDVIFRHALQPDRLPDAALGGVEHPAGLQGLLAPRLCAVAGGVLHRHPQAVAAGAVELRGDIQRKGPVAAPVTAHQMAVHLYSAGVVHRAEMQQHPTARPGGRRKVPVVVQPLSGLQRAPHPGGAALRRVGHQDLTIPARRALCRGGDGILPQAVQVLVAVPAHGRAGIFRQRVHTLTSLFYSFAPF